LLLSPIFLGISNFISSITQMHKRFLIYALSPIVYNIGIIVGIVFLYHCYQII
jgi:putative peptidoglycan lipid II flippase